MILGIDLGTTNSSAAYMTPEGPRLIANALGELLTPSVVGIDLQGEVLVGQSAKDLQVTHPERCAAPSSGRSAPTGAWNWRATTSPRKSFRASCCGR